MSDTPLSGCCKKQHNKINPKQVSPCCEKKGKIDVLFISGLIVAFVCYFGLVLFKGNLEKYPKIFSFLSNNFKFINDMSIGVIFGFIAIYILEFVPKSLIHKVIGEKNGIRGITRAVIIGFLFDICSHGVLMIANKLYKQGVSLPKIIAFLTATPWNSISLTIIMISLLGYKITLIFVVLSLLIGVLTGLIFEFLIKVGVLNNNQENLENIAEEKKDGLTFKEKIRSKKFFKQAFIDSLKDSKMIVKWLVIGTLLASFIDSVVPTDIFKYYLGPTILGLLITLFFALIIEVCSQQTLPIATIIITKAGALGNAFVFLMAGITTNYSQVLILKNMTKSWKTPIFMFLAIVPQILVLGYLLNFYHIK